MSATRSLFVVEDRLADIALLREACAEVAPQVTIEAVRTAALAWARLTGDGPLPDLVLLDINLAVSSGLDLLRDLRALPRTADLPVVVFSTSRAEADHARARDLGATAYVPKPLLFGDLRHVVRTLVTDYLAPDEPPPGHDARA